MLHTIIGTQMTVPVFLICIFLAAAVGLGTAFLFSFKSRHTASMFLTLSIMPAAIALVIMLVNGNIGAGVAVAGAFALVRFRSVPGTAREIAAIFVDMALGLACGMGEIALAIIFFAIMAVLVLILTLTGLGDRGNRRRQLKITIPENLDYNELFDDLLEEYTVKSELIQVKTTNMGTLYELCYDVVLKDEEQTKEFLDELRCRNGNLSIALGRITDNGAL
ncbi:MAG: DUF4956 domain-containing protein [Clostridia bacterium]|nr:DUF4956 domain-containing protein [Clostridia bacterium]